MAKQEKGIQSLAEQLSAVMNHPDMPDELYNIIGDWVNDSFHNGLNLSEPWVINRALERAALRNQVEAERGER